jgi:hypothetical protein
MSEWQREVIGGADRRPARWDDTRSSKTATMAAGPGVGAAHSPIVGSKDRTFRPRCVRPVYHVASNGPLERRGRETTGAGRVPPSCLLPSSVIKCRLIRRRVLGTFVSRNGTDRIANQHVRASMNCFRWCPQEEACPDRTALRVDWLALSPRELTIRCALLGSSSGTTIHSWTGACRAAWCPDRGGRIRCRLGP